MVNLEYFGDRAHDFCGVGCERKGSKIISKV